jgi:hypothetical protein
MTHRTYEHISMLLLLMKKRSGKARIRLSQKSIQEISGRSTIKSALIDHINQWLEPEATLIKLNGGGYTLVAQSALEGVPPLKIGDVVPDWKNLEVADIEGELEQDDE